MFLGFGYLLACAAVDQSFAVPCAVQTHNKVAVHTSKSFLLAQSVQLSCFVSSLYIHLFNSAQGVFRKLLKDGLFEAKGMVAIEGTFFFFKQIEKGEGKFSLQNTSILTQQIFCFQKVNRCEILPVTILVPSNIKINQFFHS